MTPREQAFLSALESLLSQVDAAVLQNPPEEFGFSIGDKIGDSTLLQVCPMLLTGMVETFGPRVEFSDSIRRPVLAITLSLRPIQPKMPTQGLNPLDCISMGMETVLVVAEDGARLTAKGVVCLRFTEIPFLKILQQKILILSNG